MWGDRGHSLILGLTVLYCVSQDLIFAILRRSFFQLSSFYEFCDLLASRETARDVICSLIFNTGTQIYVLFCLSCLTNIYSIDCSSVSSIDGRNINDEIFDDPL